MKKLTLILAILFAVGLVGAFAQVEPTITGSATGSVGYDLDNGTYGIMNEVSSSISLTVTNGSKDKTGEGDIYGVIMLDGFNIAWGSDLGTKFDLLQLDADGEATTYIVLDNAIVTDGFLGVKLPFVVTAPTVTAKIVMMEGKAYVQIADRSVAASGKVAVLEDDLIAELSEDGNTAGSLKIGGTFDPVTLAVIIGTEGNYGDTAVEDGIVLGAEFSAAVAPLTIEGNLAVDLNAGAGTAANVGFGVKATAAVAPITFYAALNGVNTTAFVYEAGAGLSVALMEGTSVGADVYYATDNLDAKLTAAAVAGPATLSATVKLLNLTTTLAWTVDASATIVASEQATLIVGGGYGSDTIANASVEADLNVINNCLIFAKWAGNDLTSVDAAEVVDLGDVIVGAKITF